MPPEVIVAIVSAVGLILSGVLVELIRTGRAVRSMSQPNGGSSMRDAVDRIEEKVSGLDSRVAVVEAILRERDPRPVR